MQSSTKREGFKMGGQEGFSESTLGWFRGGDREGTWERTGDSPRDGGNLEVGVGE